jgi:hypothetical protein
VVDAEFLSLELNILLYKHNLEIAANVERAVIFLPLVSTLKSIVVIDTL